MAPELFTVGQKVTWADNLTGAMRDIASKDGAGPFTVLQVDTYEPADCTCGGSLFDEAHMSARGCPLRYPRHVVEIGHPQRVTLGDAWGNPIICRSADLTWSLRLSGAYLKSA